MTPDQARDAILDCLADIAPDADTARLADDAELREALDLDSMDVFNLIAAIAERTGVDIPDAALPRLATLDALVAHVVDAQAAPS
jgi:acyl carrier protein